MSGVRTAVDTRHAGPFMLATSWHSVLSYEPTDLPDLPDLTSSLPPI